MLTRKLGRKKAHRDHMLRNLAASLILHEKVETTLAKAKEVKKLLDSSVNTAKKETLSARRQLMADYFDAKVVDKLIDDLAKRFSGRPSGFARSWRTTSRHGDGTPQVLVRLIPPTPSTTSKKAPSTDIVPEPTVENDNAN